MKSEIPLPIMFSPVKHHLIFIRDEIQQWKSAPWQDTKAYLLQIGNNLIDFYTGKLTVEQICTETLAFFENNEILEKNAFLDWLQAPNWKKILLSDGSEWLIKAGNDGKRYIHIHPAKFSLHTIRVRATTLKTVIALLVNGISPNILPKFRLEKVNYIRKTQLNLSPIKSLHTSESGIMRLWLLIDKVLQQND